MSDIRLLEAILFATDKPMQVSDLMPWFPSAEDVEILSMLKKLRQDYEGRGVELCDNGGHWSFKTAPDLGEAMNMEVEVERKLSRAAQETLAIIAYHQPLTRAEIENIRGVATGRGTLWNRDG